MALVGFLYWESLTKLVRSRLVEQRYRYLVKKMLLASSEMRKRGGKEKEGVG